MPKYNQVYDNGWKTRNMQVCSRKFTGKLEPGIYTGKVWPCTKILQQFLNGARFDI